MRSFETTLKELLAFYLQNAFDFPEKMLLFAEKKSEFILEMLHTLN